ncbi:hypothetical protein RM543_17120 [Roseicyclus sp. F158]|uniref:Uncharacterized protein n=1 Tax=Tropicimonas omnivorans TaxID=3075590 RepID=A0ABU3DL32_9RHOB|nr:hypothetical protein [Roseicyclus sp. F158]MDT0684407.1 hypothetical protein [Roseicyclus sp. F158]
MPPVIADALTLTGLFLTLVGAGVAARAVILRPEDAVRIGVSRIADATFEENLKLSAVQNLLRSSRLAKWGLGAVAVGTLFQAVPVAARLFL